MAPADPSGRAKALAIQQAARQGTAVLLQDTHLDAVAGAVWAAGLIGCRAVLCPVLTSDRGGQAGGVGVCYPDDWHLLSSRPLVDGYALEAIFRMGGPGARALCARTVYLLPPPHPRRNVPQRTALGQRHQRHPHPAQPP